MSDTTNEKIWLSAPHMGNYEREFVNEAFDTNWIAPLGPNVDNFEQDLKDFTGSPNVAALNSGTAAIHLALILLDVKKDDFVLCQSFTFSATANPVLYQQAIPIFIDSEPETWNMDPDALETAIRQSLQKGVLPKAIITVHLYGMPCKMQEILSIADRYGIPVIEDAAEALGSTYFGKPCGSLSYFGILSFNGNKIITTSGGGALLSGNEQQIRKARFLATQARDPAPHYQHSHTGYNYRMSNVLAGIGRGQMKVLKERISQRRANFDFYCKTFKDVEGISFLQEPEGSYSNRWLSCILVDPIKTGGITREHIRLEMEANNIESRPFWKPMHLQPVFEAYQYFGSDVSEKLFQNGLCLPSGSSLTNCELNRIIENVNKLLISLKLK